MVLPALGQLFIAPLIRMSENQTKGGGKSYTYLFTPESSYPLMKCGHDEENTCHGDGGVDTL